MSSLWTPSGEHPVGDRRPSGPAGSGDQGGSSTPPRRSGGDDQPVREARTGAASSRTERAASEAELEALRKQLAAAPAETVIANHCYGLFELAAVYLAERPAKLADARLAIDAFGYLVDGLGDRLGEPSAALRDALTQIRLAFVQVEGATRAANQQADGQRASGASSASA